MNLLRLAVVDRSDAMRFTPGQVAVNMGAAVRVGAVDFACLQPGHLDAGMKGRVVVR